MLLFFVVFDVIIEGDEFLKIFKLMPFLSKNFSSRSSFKTLTLARSYSVEMDSTCSEYSSSLIFCFSADTSSGFLLNEFALLLITYKGLFDLLDSFDNREWVDFSCDYLLDFVVSFVDLPPLGYTLYLASTIYLSL